VFKGLFAGVNEKKPADCDSRRRLIAPDNKHPLDNCARSPAERTRRPAKQSANQALPAVPSQNNRNPAPTSRAQVFAVLWHDELPVFLKKTIS
jgi:hypothetical protein